ncbi:MAG: GNAT family N-acetyltransferase [Pseudomonadota bacterium]
MRIDLPEGQRRASFADWRQVADITAEGFADDPVNRWMVGTPRGIQSAFRTMTRDLYIKQGFTFLAGDDGATMWAPPGSEAGLGPLARLRFAFGMARYAAPGAMKRALEIGKRMAEHHPKEPHMYLFTIATRKSGRGKGVGKALLAPVLAACDRDRVPVYLENSNPEGNFGFYHAHGFERITSFPVGEGGPMMEPMWREPR